MRFTIRFFLLFALTCITASQTIAQASHADSLKEIQRQIEILTQEIERMKLGAVAENRYEATRGLGPAAARVYQLNKTGVSIAGYGEVVYENYSSSREDGRNSNKKDQIDYLRNVLYVGFRFNDWIIFNSEIEFEHGSTGKPGGEVSVEFGYVDLMFSKQLNVRAGMVLSPMGIINEKHEPTTFFGALRPQVERSVIPTTWRMNGIGLYGELGSAFDYRIYLVEGLDASKFSDADGVRGGRQSGSRAIVENFGLTGKLEYKGISGAVLGSSFYSGNSGQGLGDTQGLIDASTTLFSLHGEVVWKGFELRGLYATVSIDQADRLSRSTNKTIGSSMNGWYLVTGYDVIPLLAPGSEHYLAPFVQYERLNTHASVPSGYAVNKSVDRSVLSVGISYKPHPNVAFKIDYRDNKNEAKTGIPQWNVAVNYLY